MPSKPEEEMKAASCHLIAFCLCLLRTAAEESPLPRELLERLSRSEIHSIRDLQRLLEIDSVDNEVMEETKHSHQKDLSHSFHDRKSSLQAHTRHKRSIVVEEAVPALCKVRTVIYDIPRAQVDASSANFIVWPSCVELRRCSGCCNTGNLCCQPSRIHHRTVKVAKVEYVRRRPKLREVQIRLEEHLECTCTHRPPNGPHTRSDNGIRVEEMRPCRAGQRISTEEEKEAILDQMQGIPHQRGPCGEVFVSQSGQCTRPATTHS
ncbi:unnamed protein product, partial [Gadus morhua 'NCC']